MMGHKIRKFAVGLAALSVLMGIFLLYMRINRTPPILVDAATSTPAPVADANESGSEGEIGSIAGVRVGKVKDTDYLHRDKAGKVDRRFGFHELLHERGNQWEIAKPYMDLFLPEVVCRVTADRGTVELDDVFGQPMPTSAMFKGNVVIHLIPTGSDNSWECFIQLDDVGFLAEKSLFSSTGAVRFLSRPVRLTGTGMELVYNTARSRVEVFRIFDLDSLRARSSEVEAASGVRSSDKKQADEKPQAVEKDAVAIAADAEKKPTASDSNAPTPDVYQCVFHKNVRLDSPDGVAVARRLLAINNIQWSRPEKPLSKSVTTTDPNKPAPAVSADANALDTTVSSYVAMSSIPEELYDIAITCDGGAAITLTNGPQRPAEALVADTGGNPAAGTAVEELSSSDPNQVVAQRIDFDFVTNDATMLGPFAAKVVIDPNSLGQRAGGGPMPAVVTAQKAVRFLAAAERVVLEGDFTATVYRSDPNADDEYRLAADRVTADLTIDSNSTGDVNVEVRRFVADAGDVPADAAAAAPPVTVRMWRRVSGELLGWGALGARELQYEAKPDRLTASGPGEIWLHNNTTIRSKTDPNARPLEPCYVRMSNFDTLTYWSLSNRIIAEDDAQQLLVNHFPLVEGKPGPETRVVAGHVEATLMEAPEGRLDLASLVASKGIEYDSEADHWNFIGSELVYDRITSLMVVRGDDLRPCYLNGVLVDQIVVDPKTGRIEAEVPSTSVFQVGP
jgi:hypothetical protein